MPTAVRALFFDVFGTLVDWRTSIAREAQRILAPLGHSHDWSAFADAWRGEYQPAMDEVRSGRIPFCKLDVLHRHNLERILPRFGISGLDRTGHAGSQSRLASPRCLAGCAGRARPAQAPLLAGAGLERQHLADGRSGAPQRLAVGCHPRLGSGARFQAQATRLSLGLRSLRPAAGRLHDGGRAQQRSCPCGEVRAADRHTLRVPTSMVPARAKPHRPCRSMSAPRASTNWR